MRLVCLSLSLQQTPPDLRSCIALPAEAIQPALARHPVRQSPFEPLREAAILSTCNRFEVYAVVSSPQPGSESLPAVVTLLSNYLQEGFQIPAGQAGPYFQSYTDLEVVRHLFRVAAGLDSIALGETQILGQVARCQEIGLAAGSVHHVLSSLFRAAIHAGKKVRTETEIGRHPANISAIGVQLAENELGSLAGKDVLVIGAGKMARLAIESLRSRGIQRLVLTNRTQAHADEIAIRSGISTLPYERIEEGLAASDLVFTATAASQPVLYKQTIARLMARRPQRSLTLVDLSMPEAVERTARNIPGVTVFAMDDLQAFVKNLTGDGTQGVSEAEGIVAGETAEYEKLLRIIPFIGELHKKIESVRQREVERAISHLHQPGPEVIEQFELFSQSLVRKILHEPTMHLREEPDGETLNEYVDALARLFNLTDDDPLERRNAWDEL